MDKENKIEIQNLRQKAEDLLKKKILKSVLSLSEAEIKKLIHELEVHQLELEMQNEELILAYSTAKEAARKYEELYDFAPSGYFTLSKKGNILEVNMSGSQILGKERLKLINSNFGFFISSSSKVAFSIFIGKVFSSKIMESCELSLELEGNMPKYAQVNGITSEDGEQCYITMVDITKRKLAEDKIKEKAKELELANSQFVGRELKMIELKKEVNELLKRIGEKERY
jgi:PAS domain S-box-containing protein